MVRAALISDIHGRSLSDKVRRYLEKCDLIICAGDTEDLGILSEMEAIAPLTAVRGNCDWRPWADELPKDAVVKIEDVSIYVIHNLDYMSFEPDSSTDAVVYGHTHVYKHFYRNDVLYINPGSVSEPRGGQRAHMVVLEIEGKKIRVRSLFADDL